MKNLELAKAIAKDFVELLNLFGERMLYNDELNALKDAAMGTALERLNKAYPEEPQLPPFDPTKQNEGLIGSDGLADSVPSGITD